MSLGSWGQYSLPFRTAVTRAAERDRTAAERTFGEPRPLLAQRRSFLGLVGGIAAASGSIAVAGFMLFHSEPLTPFEKRERANRRRQERDRAERRTREIKEKLAERLAD